MGAICGVVRLLTLAKGRAATIGQIVVLATNVIEPAANNHTTVGVIRRHSGAASGSVACRAKTAISADIGVRALPRKTLTCA